MNSFSLTASDYEEKQGIHTNRLEDNKLIPNIRQYIMQDNRTEPRAPLIGKIFMRRKSNWVISRFFSSIPVTGL